MKWKRSSRWKKDDEFQHPLHDGIERILTVIHRVLLLLLIVIFLECTRQNTISTRFTMIFELGSSHQSSANILRPSVSDLNSSMLAQIAEYVAATGETLNISDVLEWLKDKSICQRQTVVQQAPAADGTVATTDSFDETHSVKSILCMPIINGQKTVIGVAQLINKVHSAEPKNTTIDSHWLA